MSIFILKSQGIEPMLIGSLGIRSNEGIYLEVEEDNIPKKYRIEKLGGSSVINDKYMRSNTTGITQGKYFQKIAEPLDFEPIQKDKFELLKDNSIKINFDQVVKILQDTDNDSIYRLNFQTSEYGLFNLNAIRVLEDDEIEVQEHQFKEYEKNFKGMYQFKIQVSFGVLTTEQVSEIRTISNKRNIKINLFTLLNIIDKYNLGIVKENTYYVKERTNFTGKYSEGPDVFNKSINEIMTFAEASKKWELDDSTLRKLVKTNKIEENIDYRKSGNVWLITKNSMERIYGKLKSED